MSKDSPDSTRILTTGGRHTVASYLEQEIPSYRGNPFIEALPPIMTEDQVMEALARYPQYDEKERLLPAHLRLHAVQSVLRCFVPLPVHLDLEQRFSRMIRAGYQRRNPIAFGCWSRLEASCCSLGNSTTIVPNSADPLPLGFTIIGFPGVGKSTSVEAVLSLYPQVIYHGRYAERDFNVAQVVWLKLECPFDGSPKGLCINFFHAFDQMLGTNYEFNYAGVRRTTDELLPKMARLTAIHGLGVLVIDEINRLSGMKGAGLRLLSFFVQLTNSMGVPVVLVGTYKAKTVLAGEFHQIRRGTGQGDLVWDRMEEGEWIEDDANNAEVSTKNPGVWQLLLESLWTYQYTRVPCPLTKELSHVLYEETQGITDFAAKVYMLAQVRAIVTARTSDEELITPDIIRSVARDSLKQAQPVLAALRRGDMDYISIVPDLRPIAIDEFIRTAERKLRNTTPTSTTELTEAAPVPTPYGERQPSNQSASKRKKLKGKKQGVKYDANDLRAASAGAASSDTSVFETLQRAGHIGDASEYLDVKEQT